MKIATAGAPRSTQDNENPLWLLFLGRPPLCAGCGTALPPRFCGLEVRYEDVAGNPFQILAPVCSLSCQELLIDDVVSDGRPVCVAWSPDKLRAALDDIENFEAVIDLSIESLERRIVEALNHLADDETEGEA